MSLGREAIRLQKRIFQDVQQEIAFFREVVSDDIRKYERAYRREFNSFEKTTEGDLLQAMQSANFTLIGDYHPLARSQKSFLKLFQKYLDCHKNPAETKSIFALECFHYSKQAVLDRFQRGEISLTKLREDSDYDARWPFPWKHYEPIFRYAFRHSIPLLALNSGSGKASLQERDFTCAEILTNAASRFSGHHFFVLFGELHLARKAMPKYLREMLRSNNLPRKITTIFQNEPKLYWKMAPQNVEIVRLSARTFCILNCTPWVRLQSYIDWMEGGLSSVDTVAQKIDDEDTDAPISYPESADNTEAMLEVSENAEAKIVLFKRYLSEIIRPAENQDTLPNLYFPRDIPELRLAISARQKKFAKACVLNNQIFYAPEKSIMYLPGDSINVFGEAAAHILVAEQDPFYSFAHNPFTDMSQIILNYTRGFFASLLINHRRKCEEIEDLHLRYTELRRNKHKTPHQKYLQVALKWTLLQAEFFFEDTRARFFQPNSPNYTFAMGFMAARYLGNILGERIFLGYQRGLIDIDAIRTFYAISITSEKHARRVAFDWAQSVRQVQPHIRQKRDWY